MKLYKLLVANLAFVLFIELGILLVSWIIYMLILRCIYSKIEDHSQRS